MTDIYIYKIKFFFFLLQIILEKGSVIHHVTTSIPPLYLSSGKKKGKISSSRGISFVCQQVLMFPFHMGINGH